MLVCNVSARPKRLAIAAELAEAITAADDTAGGIVFAALVDDPASAHDAIDAFLGQIMLETASANDVISCGGAIDADMVEAAAANSVQSWAVPAVLATFDGVAVTVTLSNGNLTATHSTNSSTAGARSTNVKSSGKYYFEVTVGQHTNSSSVRDCCGILLSTSTTYNDMLSTATNCSMVMYWSGHVFSNNVDSGKNLGAIITGNIISAAIDLDNRKAWFRKNGGNWNGLAIGSENPATNTGGAVIAAGSFSPAVAFNWVTGDSQTGNFGQSSFSYAPPAGFGSWS